VVGEVMGEKSLLIGDADYRYPILTSKFLHLWPRARRYPDDYPFDYYYPPYYPYYPFGGLWFHYYHSWPYYHHDHYWYPHGKGRK